MEVRRLQILPQARIGAVTVRPDLDPVAGRRRGPGKRRHHGGNSGSFARHRRASLPTPWS